MNHHSQKPLDLNKQAKELNLGATGEFPDGQISPDDEGEIQIGITHHNGQIIMNFGKSVRWLAFDPKLAKQIAESLRQHAAAVVREQA